MQQTTNATNAIIQKTTIKNSWVAKDMSWSKTHFCSNPGILLMNPLLFNALALAATMFLSGRPECGRERAVAQNVQGWFFPQPVNCCRRVWFVRSVPADTFCPHRPPDALMTGCVYAKSYSRTWLLPWWWYVKLADNGNYIISEIYLSPEICYRID